MTRAGATTLGSGHDSAMAGSRDLLGAAAALAGGSNQMRGGRRTEQDLTTCHLAASKGSGKAYI